MLLFYNILIIASSFGHGNKKPNKKDNREPVNNTGFEFCPYCGLSKSTYLLIKEINGGHIYKWIYQCHNPQCPGINLMLDQIENDTSQESEEYLERVINENDLYAIDENSNDNEEEKKNLEEDESEIDLKQTYEDLDTSSEECDGKPPCKKRKTDNDHKEEGED